MHWVSFVALAISTVYSSCSIDGDSREFSLCHIRAKVESLRSMIEMQAIAVDLVENFQFSIPKEKPEIIRVPAGIMIPMVKEKMHEGTQMPLHVTAL